MAYDDALRDYISHGRPTHVPPQGLPPMVLIETDYVDYDLPQWVVEGRKRALRAQGWVYPQYQLKETGNLLGHKYRLEWWGTR